MSIILLLYLLFIIKASPLNYCLCTIIAYYYYLLYPCYLLRYNNIANSSASPLLGSQGAALAGLDH